MNSSQHNAERDQSSSPEPITPSSPLSPPRVRAQMTFQGSSGENLSHETRPLAQTSTAINRKEESGTQTRDMDELTLNVDGDLDKMTKDWSIEELHDSRRIVAFRKFLSVSTLDVSFEAVTADAMLPDGFYISCIKRDDVNGYYFTQNDIIRLIEWLHTWSHTEPFPYRLIAEEKSQILQTLDDFKPLTVSKVKAETEDLFKLIMSLSHPQPSSFEVQIEAHRWEALLPALQTVMDKYSAHLKSYFQSREPEKIEHIRVDRIIAKPFSSRLPATTAYKLEETDPDKRQIYISELADSFVRMIKGLDIDKDALNRVSVILSNLLEAFALRIGHKAPTPLHRRIMNFVFENRDSEISTVVKDRLSEPGDLQAKSFPSSDNTSIDDTVGAWLGNLDLSPKTDKSKLSTYTQYEDPIIDSPKDNYSETHPSKIQEDTDSWLAAYHELVPKTEGYQWLLSLSSLKMNHRTPTRTYDAEFEVDWDIMNFLEKQQYGADLHETIERIITVTGSYKDSFVTTCGQYINQTWPSSGEIIMQLVTDLVEGKVMYPTSDSSTGTLLRAEIEGSKVLVTANGPMTCLVEVGEQLAWLGAALRVPPHDRGLACCSPFISVPAIGTKPALPIKSIFIPPVKFKIGFRDEIQQDSSRLNGKCWHNLFKNPMVVKGYPIPARVDTGTGAEIPLNIMAGLARTQRVDCFKGMTFIKSFSTLLVPTKRTGDTIFWHLFYNKDGHRISYLDSTITSLGYPKSLDLEQCRHVLGWCEEARFYAGSAKANYFVMNSALPPPHEGCSLVSTYVSPGRSLVGGPAFSLGTKDTPVHVSRSGYIPRLQWIATKYVLLWDESEKRGWLVNGTSALLHIVRASLAYNNKDKFNFAFIFRESDFQESAKPFTADSAIDMLIDPKNLALKLYREKDGFLLLESRIEYFYNILEKLIDHQADIAGERGVNMADKPRRYLEGWEFNDLAMSRDPIYPRVASIEPRGKSWVDFTRAIHAVTLFGRGFGDIIKSTGADMCEYWAEVPKQKYYLTACLSDISQLVKENHVHNEKHDSGYPSEGKLPPPNVSDVDSLKDSGIEVDMDSPRIGVTQSSALISFGSPAPRQIETPLLETASLPSSETHSQEEYTVGILCALPKELLAVRALFDKKHDNLESVSGDSNHYALGQMDKHMIAASCLPEYGTTSAADWGGAPSEDNDIRLGDVVVSLPTAGYPGVVQYDRGKEKDNNVFELTGSLPPPPRSLMTAISSLRSDPDLPSYPLQPYIDEIINRVPESMRSRYKHPGQEHDQLFKAVCPKCQSREECPDRDGHVTKRSQRPTDDPGIHYGLIASGNHVIKNSQTRDKWAQDHGVLCFEMEAAGIMNIFPSLVIRGICDYADAFKNKLWQEYAAATAAAYAKLLLGVVASPDKSHYALGLVRRKGSVSERPDELHHKRRRLDHATRTADGRLWIQIKDAFNDPKARLHASVRDNDMSALRSLVPLCGTIALELNYCDPDFGSALQVAVLCDNMTAAGILLDAGANPWASNGFTEPQTSAMETAIQTGNRDMFTRMCEKTVLGYSKSPQQLRTLLSRTTLHGQTAMVEDVLGWADGWSEAVLENALANAVSGWHVEVVRLLLARFRYSPLCINLSLCRAADFRADLLSHPRAECNGLDCVNQQELISCLVSAGADPNNNAEELNLVVAAATWVDLVGALKALLDNGADPNGRGPSWRNRPSPSGDEFGNTPLHYAAFGSNMHSFSLYTAGLPVDSPHNDALKSIRNNSGETLLHWAAAGKKIDILRVLLSSGADVNAANDNGWTPLMCAVAPSTATETCMPRYYQALQAARIILDHGADPLACTAEGWTPLHCLSLYLDDGDGDNNKLADLARSSGKDVSGRNNTATDLRHYFIDDGPDTYRTYFPPPLPPPPPELQALQYELEAFRRDLHGLVARVSRLESGEVPQVQAPVVAPIPAPSSNTANGTQ
ncbi:hypothetical protein MKX08_004235 [Trichoderma sp. CBMAI-0020]|nr:hypothetical protein MKX08_004235 [Trichoderma sp. CBMAI-0020]